MTTTTTTTAQSFYVSAEHEGFAFEPDQAIGFAVADLLVAQAAGFDRELTCARALAAADEASTLSRPKRAEFASAVLVDHPTRKDYALSLSASTYSKRVRAGRATDDEVLAFLMVCDTPSLDKLYESLPKAATGRPKGAKTGKGRSDAARTADDANARANAKQADAIDAADAADAATTTVSVPETPVTPCRWDDAHISTAATAMVAALRQQGADDVSARLVAAEAMRLLSPVRSVA